jgi:hypothetical protein
MKPPFTSSQEMYNYAANQLMNQNLSQETVKKNLMERGVTDADAEIVVQNMLVAIEKQRNAKEGTNKVDTKSAERAVSPPPPPPSPQNEAYTKNNYGSFASLQEMYNYAADQLIVKKLSQQTTKTNLMNYGVSATDADVVIKNMMAEIEKNKPVQVNAKRAEGKKMILVGLLIVGIGAVLAGTNFKIAGETFAFTYGIMAVGAILFFRGLFKMF